MLTRRKLIAVTDVSGQTVGPIFMSQAVHEDSLDCLVLEDGPDRLSRNVGTRYQPTSPNIPEERRPELHCGGSLKSRKAGSVLEMLATTLFTFVPHLPAV
jgi:hypothetical protein